MSDGRAVAVAALLAALAACGSRPAVRPQTVPASGTTHAPPQERDAGGVGRPLARTADRPSLFLPPAAQGAVRVDIEGCMAEGGDEAAARRHPAQPATRSGPRARVSELSSGVIVTHALTHACCLTAQVAAAVEGKNVRVVETLSGTPCRCLCESTLRTAVGLAPGEYDLVLSLSREGNLEEVHRQTVRVEALGPARPPGVEK